MLFCFQKNAANFSIASSQVSSSTYFSLINTWQKLESNLQLRNSMRFCFCPFFEKPFSCNNITLLLFSQNTNTHFLVLNKYIIASLFLFCNTILWFFCVIKINFNLSDYKMFFSFSSLMTDSCVKVSAEA